MTSPAVLTRLRELPVTNKALYNQFKGNTSTALGAEHESDNAQVNGEEIEDSSDVTVAAAIGFVMSGSKDVPDGLQIDANGGLERVGVAEDLDIDAEDPRIQLIEPPISIRPSASRRKTRRTRRRTQKEVDEMEWLDE